MYIIIIHLMLGTSMRSVLNLLFLTHLHVYFVKYINCLQNTHADVLKIYKLCNLIYKMYIPCYGNLQARMNLRILCII